MEGSITVAVAMVAFFFLPDTPGAARFLTEREQWLAAHRLRVDLQAATASDRVEEEHFNWQEVEAADASRPRMSMLTNRLRSALLSSA